MLTWVLYVIFCLIFFRNYQILFFNYRIHLHFLFRLDLFYNDEYLNLTMTTINQSIFPVRSEKSAGDLKICSLMFRKYFEKQSPISPWRNWKLIKSKEENKKWKRIKNVVIYIFFLFFKNSHVFLFFFFLFSKNYPIFLSSSLFTSFKFQFSIYLLFIKTENRNVTLSHMNLKLIWS